ncbi:MAG: hypothetical protein ACI4BI_04300 [Anaerotardibacter sp.]
MSNLTNGLTDIFLAGVGALAITGEKAKNVVDTLIEKGELTVEQGKEINTELTHKAMDSYYKVREDALERQMALMSDEDRAAFVASVLKVAENVEASKESVAQDEEAPAAEPEQTEE